MDPCAVNRVPAEKGAVRQDWLLEVSQGARAHVPPDAVGRVGLRQVPFAPDLVDVGHLVPPSWIGLLVVLYQGGTADDRLLPGPRGQDIVVFRALILLDAEMGFSPVEPIFRGGVKGLEVSRLVDPVATGDGAVFGHDVAHTLGRFF